jgi:hypothetical protein
LGCDSVSPPARAGCARTQAAEIKMRKRCEQELETCRQERKREQAERESERERERADWEQSAREVSEKAVKFVESEIMRLNETMLRLG